jgi:hypothetical protein
MQQEQLSKDELMKKIRDIIKNDRVFLQKCEELNKHFINSIGLPKNIQDELLSSNNKTNDILKDIEVNSEGEPVLTGGGKFNGKVLFHYLCGACCMTTAGVAAAGMVTAPIAPAFACCGAMCLADGMDEQQRYNSQLKRIEEIENDIKILQGEETIIINTIIELMKVSQTTEIKEFLKNKRKELQTIRVRIGELTANKDRMFGGKKKRNNRKVNK